MSSEISLGVFNLHFFAFTMNNIPLLNHTYMLQQQKTKAPCANLQKMATPKVTPFPESEIIEASQHFNVIIWTKP